MFNLRVERIGEVAVVRCKGRIVRSDAAFQLRDAVTAQRHSRVILLDLSEVGALEGGGLGMLQFLKLWVESFNIQLQVLAPLPAVRHRLERTCYAAVDSTGVGEMRSLLGPGRNGDDRSSSTHPV